MLEKMMAATKAVVKDYKLVASKVAMKAALLAGWKAGLKDLM